MKMIIMFLACSLITSVYANAQTPDPSALPKYPGDMPAFYDYVKSELKYPATAKAANIQGKVWVEFYVNTDGKVDKTSIQIVKGIHPDCDKEAIRIISNSKPWIPGMRNGKPSREKFVLYIQYVLDPQGTKK